MADPLSCGIEWADGNNHWNKSHHHVYNFKCVRHGELIFHIDCWKLFPSRGRRKEELMCPCWCHWNKKGSWRDLEAGSGWLLLLLLSHFSHVLSLGFSRHEYWSGLLFPSPVHESEKWKWSRSVDYTPIQNKSLKKLKDTCSLEENLDKPRQNIKAEASLHPKSFV